MPFKKGQTGNPKGNKLKRIDSRGALIKASWNFLLKEMKSKDTPLSEKRKIAQLVAGKTAPQDVKAGHSDRLIIIKDPRPEQQNIADNSLIPESRLPQ